jgi:OFA family oxalate/formate antiporter-like MFS transporter
MKKKFDYSIVIFVISFFVVCISLGFCSSNRSMYFQAITDVFDGSITKFEYSFTMTIRYVVTTLLNVFFGVLVNKFGQKVLMSAGFCSLIAFALVNSFATNIIHFYIASVFLGMGLAWTTTTMISTVINNWATKNKATITGAVLAANGLGGAVAAQILSPIIFSDGGNGFRTAYRLVAIILAAMLVIILVFFKDRPKGAEKILVAGKGKTRKARGESWVGMDFSEIKKKPYFYLAILCLFLTGMSLNGLGEIAQLQMYEVGLDKQFVANLATFSSLLLMGSKFLNGFMYDRFGIKKTMSISYFSAFLALICILLISDTAFGQIIAAVRPLFTSIAAPLETVMIAVFASELFGSKSFGKVVGMFSAATTAGFALASPFSQLWHLLFGDYNFAMAAFAVFMIFVTVTMHVVVRLAGRDRLAIIEAHLALTEKESVPEA